MDTWAAGCILFKLLWGHVPFPGTNIEVHNQIKQANIKWPPENIIDEVMSKDA